MNDENIAQLIVELDKLAPYVPTGNTFTSVWLEQQYAGVTSMRDQGKPYYRNEYRIVKLLIKAYTATIVAHRDKIMIFIPACRIIKSIEDSLKEIYNQRQSFRPTRAEVERILALPL
ncbi:hypothetical protein ACJMK2_041542 [Sinanodonta woodiana]|uniref:Uncharacterized protein n=1 Tax=Sinanodonta woodiana TaxID=1069815 RepID=A0ABD3W4H6_SINWO